MGANQSLYQDLLPVEDTLESHPVLGAAAAGGHFAYVVERKLLPGSGRIVAAWKVVSTTSSSPRHHNNNNNTRVAAAAAAATTTTTAVLKAMWVEDDKMAQVQRVVAEMARVRQLLLSSPPVSASANNNDTTTLLPPRYAVPYGFVGAAVAVRPLPHHLRNTTPTTPTVLRPVYVLRPHLYTTLADRVASRPWYTSIEKLHVVRQLCDAVQHLHDHDICHGHLVLENVGVTATGWIMLLDVAYHQPVCVPDDDPADYFKYFASRDGSNKRCYLAPERIVSSDVAAATTSSPPVLTPAMDIFSLGCVVTELYLNGSERCCDLGELLAYKKTAPALPASMTQKLTKIEHSHVRAMCKHMLSWAPTARLASASMYWERLRSFVPHAALDAVHAVLARITVPTLSPDAQLAMLVAAYGNILWHAVGVPDALGELMLQRVLGPVAATGLGAGGKDVVSSNADVCQQEAKQAKVNNTKHAVSSVETLMAETEALLQKINDLSLDGDGAAAGSHQTDTTRSSTPSHDDADKNNTTNEAGSSLEKPRTPPTVTDLSKATLLIYLQMILPTLRHVQRPDSKLVGLTLLERLATYLPDEPRLQRVVPVTVSLLQDQDALVRARSVALLTSILASIESFSPSDANIFPHYVFKKVAHMVSDPALVVRVAFAQCLATLAQTAQRFLDVSHVVRLYEAVGNNSSMATPMEDLPSFSESNARAIFADDVARLLGNDNAVDSDGGPLSERMADSSVSEATVTASGRMLINSTYKAELASLQETVSRWVVHIATDQSDSSALPKRAFLGNLDPLCSFLGLEGVMSFVLPQILAFLNERKDAELRTALFDALPAVCTTIGRAASEEYVLPCVEIGLVDTNEKVIEAAVRCLATLIRIGVVSQVVLLGNKSPGDISTAATGLLKVYGPLLVYPAARIRRNALHAVQLAISTVGLATFSAIAWPALRPFFRVQLAAQLLTMGFEMNDVVAPPIPRNVLNRELNGVISNSYTWTAAAPKAISQWTSVGSDERARRNQDTCDGIEDSAFSNDCLEGARHYIELLARHKAQSKMYSGLLPNEGLRDIEGSVKLAQSVMFPRENGLHDTSRLPEWFESIRNSAASSDSGRSLTVASIQSVGALGSVYGLSIMGHFDGASDGIIGAADISDVTALPKGFDSRSYDALLSEAAHSGHWGAETSLEADVVDTSLLVAKLLALRIPPLPMNLGNLVRGTLRPPGAAGALRQSSNLGNFKTKMTTLVATGTSHTAPVVRLAVSADKSFFVSASHDGTCRVWETRQLDESFGVLEPVLIYDGHTSGNATRVNDLAMVEGTHSVISGCSDGSVHVWRVDTVLTNPKPVQSTTSTELRGASNYCRVVGATAVRQVAEEGEILAVSHFGMGASSVYAYASQSGSIHSWDLRLASEPFSMHHAPQLGYITSMTFGNDRQWLLSGTSSGYMVVWDLRFHKPLRLWRHPRCAAVKRIATAYVPPPDQWKSRYIPGSERPLAFMACGPRECALYDMIDGTCYQSFNAISAENAEADVSGMEAPLGLKRVSLKTQNGRVYLKDLTQNFGNVHAPSLNTVNCMVGSLGGREQSHLITGGSDGSLTFWDFESPNKCYVASGQDRPRASFERVDFGKQRRMICRSLARASLHENYSGLRKPTVTHGDAIEDLRILDDTTLITCSRDATVKVWK